MRAARSAEALRLVTSRKFSLEVSLEFLNDDGMLYVSPKHIRIP